MLKLAALSMAAASAAASASVAGAVQRRETVAARNFPPLGDFVTVQGCRIHYLRQGSGPEVILLHGAGGNIREFTFSFMELLKDTFTVTAFDRPGLGYSDRAPGYERSAFGTEGESPQDQAQLLRLAAAEIGIKNPVIAGHSYGAIIGLAWAQTANGDPQDAAALVSIAGLAMPWPGPIDRYYRINGSALGGAFAVPILSAFATRNMVAERVAAAFAPQEVPAGYASYIGTDLTLRKDTLRANTRQINTLLPHVVEMSKTYDQLRLPIEMIHGDADTTVPYYIHASPFAERVASANLTPLAGVGHMPHHADPAACLAAIERAVARGALP